MPEGRQQNPEALRDRLRASGIFTIRQSPWKPAIAREIIAKGVVR